MPRTAPAPILDLTVAIPELGRLRDHAVAGDYAAVTQQLIAYQDESDDLIASASWHVMEVPGVERTLEERCAQSPSDVLARALLGGRQIVQAWEVRTSARAKDVSQEQFRQFHAMLARAETGLIDVCAMEPTWAFPWYLRLTTARGLELGASETARRYDRLAEHAPDHYPAQLAYLTQLLPKWSGTWERAREFAETCAANAAPGSASHTLVAEMHLERWLDVGGGDEGRALLAESAVRQELKDAAALSVLHPQFRRGFSWVHQHSVFAAVHVLGRDPAAANPHFRALGDSFSESVWGYLGDGARKLVLAARVSALQGASR